MSEENVIEFKKADEQVAVETPELQLDEVQAHQGVGEQVQQEILNKAEAHVKALRSGWENAFLKTLEKFGDTEENRKYLLSCFAQLETASFNMAYHGIQFTELFNYYINGQNTLDLGALFGMNDHIRGFLNHAHGIPLTSLNVYDKEIAGGDDPRWSFDPLPISRIYEDPQNVRIPVKVETLNEICYGYLEAFKFQQPVGDKTVTLVTNYPTLRVKDNYITTNSIFRWFETDAETVKNAWNTGRSVVRKVPLSIVDDMSTDNEPVETE